MFEPAALPSELLTKASKISSTDIVISKPVLADPVAFSTALALPVLPLLTLDRAISRGGNLMDKITAHNTKYTPWDTTDALATAGLRFSVFDEVDSMKGLDRFLQGIEAENIFRYWSIGHSDGDAFFYQRLDIRAGLFIALVSCRQKPPPVDAISRWSDIAYLAWKAECKKNNVDPGSLKYLLQHNVTNDDTKAIVNRILTAQRKQLVSWPGHKFSMSSDEGRACKLVPPADAVDL